MNPLPEDLNQWPRDPFDLLGVPRGAEPGVVRKAYTRLIRQYKPEQFPEHFRRIREAFEFIQRFGAFTWQPPGPAPAPAPDAAPPDIAPPATPVAEDAVPEMLEPPVRQTQEADELETAWQLACAGQEQEAYQRLRRHADQPGRLQDACLRLYWLLRTAPELDPDRSPCHWLVQALRNGGWHGPCQELYRREIEHRPAEALEERCNQLLQAAAPLPVLSQWLQIRWLAAGRLGQWQVIQTDLEAARPRFQASLDDETWAYLLLAALDQLAWIMDPQAEAAATAWYQEIEEMVHLHNRLDMHRLDVLIELSNTWKQGFDRRGRPCFLELLKLVPVSWTAYPGELRLPLLHILRDALASPEEALAWFDGLKASAPFVFTQLANLIDRVAWEPPIVDMETGTPEELEGVAAAFLREKVYSYHVPPRQEFFRFCVREFLLPHQALEVLIRLPGCPPLIAECADEPVRVVCTAYRWFWA